MSNNSTFDTRGFNTPTPVRRDHTVQVTHPDGTSSRHTVHRDESDLQFRIVTRPEEPPRVITLQIPLYPGQMIQHEGFSILNLDPPSLASIIHENGGATLPPARGRFEINAALRTPTEIDSIREEIHASVLRSERAHEQRQRIIGAGTQYVPQGAIPPTDEEVANWNLRIHRHPLYDVQPAGVYAQPPVMSNQGSQGGLQDKLSIQTKLTLDGTELSFRTRLVIMENNTETIIAEDEDSVDLSELLDQLNQKED